ncbi:hypothetical protein SEA_NICEHOUSE_41 [Rhodococcus phage NiceHouse]|nr:hypothetical protein SEA_NICEHOUSE_41 [Rhodococcus phage NiceHouse]
MPYFGDQDSSILEEWLAEAEQEYLLTSDEFQKSVVRDRIQDIKDVLYRRGRRG